MDDGADEKEVHFHLDDVDEMLNSGTSSMPAHKKRKIELEKCTRLKFWPVYKIRK